MGPEAGSARDGMFDVDQTGFGCCVSVTLEM